MKISRMAAVSWINRSEQLVCLQLLAAQSSPFALCTQFGDILPLEAAPAENAKEVSALRVLAEKGQFNELLEKLKQFDRTNLPGYIKKQLDGFQKKLANGEHRMFGKMLNIMALNQNPQAAFANATGLKDQGLVHALLPAMSADFLYSQMTVILKLACDEGQGYAKEVSKALAQAVGTMLIERCKSFDDSAVRDPEKYRDTTVSLSIRKTDIHHVIAAVLLGSVSDMDGVEVSKISILKTLFDPPEEYRKAPKILPRAINRTLSGSDQGYLTVPQIMSRAIDVVRRIDPEPDQKAEEADSQASFRVLPEIKKSNAAEGQADS